MSIFMIDEQYLVLWCSACLYTFDLQSFKWFDSLITTLHNFIWSVHNFTSQVVSFTYKTNLNNLRTKWDIEKDILYHF